MAGGIYKNGKWYGAGGGSGTGGHNILNDGEALESRPALDFIDFDLADSEENEETQVKPHLLSDEEFHEIFADPPSGGGGIDGGGSSEEYYEEEKIIGNWIDGSIIYRNVVNLKADLIPSDEEILINSKVISTTATAEQYDNVITNIWTNASGNGNNWYSDTHKVEYGLIVFDSLQYISKMVAYTTDDWGLSYTSYDLYYSEDDSLTLTNYTDYTKITVNPGTGTTITQVFSTPVQAKRIVISKRIDGALYYLQVYGKKIVTTKLVDFDFTNVKELLRLSVVPSDLQYSMGIELSYSSVANTFIVSTKNELSNYKCILEYTKKP